MSTYPFQTRTLVLNDPSRPFIHRLTNHHGPVSILTVNTRKRAIIYYYLAY